MKDPYLLANKQTATAKTENIRDGFEALFARFARDIPLSLICIV